MTKSINTFTLEDLQESAEAKYASMKIQLATGMLVLRNPMRMGALERAELTAIQKKKPEAADAEAEADLDGERVLDSYRKVLRLAADDKDLADTFLTKVIGDNLALLATVVETYSNTVKAGEA